MNDLLEEMAGGDDDGDATAFKNQTEFAQEAAAPTQEVPRAAAPPPPPPPRPRTPDTPDSDDGVAAALRDEVSNLDAEIDVLRGALKAAGDRVTAASLEERAREAARAILAASSRR